MTSNLVTVSVCLIGILLLTGCTARYKSRRQRASRRRPLVTEFPTPLHDKFSTMANNFTWQLYRQLAHKRENLVFSPISVYKTLSMAYLGCSNGTAKEMFDVLGYTTLKRPRKVRKAFRHLGYMMRRPMRDVTLTMADALYVHHSIPIRNRFKRRLRKFFKTRIRRYDPDPQRKSMANMKRWIRRSSHGKIRGSKVNFSLKRNRRNALLFLNAVYFNGSWDVVFDPAKTNKSMFHVNRHTRKRVDMMFNDWRYYYKVNSELKVKVIEMPYVSHRLSFFLIVPDDVHGLANLERRLTSSTFQDLITDMDGPARFHVKMPRMHLLSDLDLKSSLQKMGIKSVFSRDADMSPIDGRRELYIDHMMHTSALDVTEGGSTGAGVTGAGIALRSVPPEVKADRPFMFVIKDKVTKTDLFIGKYSNPGS